METLTFQWQRGTLPRTRIRSIPLVRGTGGFDNRFSSAYYCPSFCRIFSHDHRKDRKLIGSNERPYSNPHQLIILILVVFFNRIRKRPGKRSRQFYCFSFFVVSVTSRDIFVIVLTLGFSDSIRFWDLFSSQNCYRSPLVDYVTDSLSLSSFSSPCGDLLCRYFIFHRCCSGGAMGTVHYKIRSR